MTRKTWKWWAKEEIASWPDGHKRCRSCNDVLAFEHFSPLPKALMGYDTICKLCRIPKSKQDWAARSPEQKLLAAARSRASGKNMACTISLADINIPTVCPVFGTPFRQGDWGPSLDRIDSSLGYTPGNVQVISWRANMLKNNATVAELKQVVAFMEKL